MRTSKKITAVFLLISCISLFAQTGVKVTYVKGLKSRKAPIYKPPSILKDISFSLIATNEKSIFRLNEKMMGDDLENRRHASKSIYYKNLKNKEKLQQFPFFGKVYLISYEFNQPKWKLHKDSKKIGKYKCYKATYERVETTINQKTKNVKTTAWYTLDIPLPFGPLEYDGLPGLILAVKTGGVYYIADKVEVNTNIKPHEIKKPTKGIKITKEEFNKFLVKKFSKYYKKK